MVRLLTVSCTLLPLVGATAHAVTMGRSLSPVISDHLATTLPVNIPIEEYSTALHSGGKQAANRAAFSFLNRIASGGWPADPSLERLGETPTAVAARVPEPASLALIGVGLIGLAATSRRRRDRPNRRC